MSQSQASLGGVGVAGVLLILFVTLKIIGLIAWPWIWVLAPLWIPIAIVLALLIVVGLFAASAWIGRAIMGA
jgi:hypothetical protein